MYSKTKCIRIAFILLVIACLPLMSEAAFAQAPKGKATIGIHTVGVTDSLKKAVATKGRGKSLSLGRVAESMGQQMIDRIHNTRKFSVVSRSDLNTILKDQDLQRYFTDPTDANIAQAFKIAGCKYALIATVDDFQDLEEELVAEGGQVIATKRTVRLSAVVKIYDTTTGMLLESANFQLSNKDGERRQQGIQADGKSSDALFTDMARMMSHKAANRVLDVVYPAKIIAQTNELVTINRGDGTGIAKGQIWSVFAIGEELIDPDTGESLGSEEVPVGKVEILAVTPKFSRAKVIEDYGVDKLQVLRLDEKEDQ